MAIAFVPPGVEAVVGDGVFDGAVGFMHVRAVGIAAQADIGTDVAVVTRDLFWHDVPELKLPDARRIDDKAADRERDQAGDRRRMLSFLILAADFADAQGQFGLNSVEQRRFADAALAGDDAFFPRDEPPQRSDALP